MKKNELTTYCPHAEPYADLIIEACAKYGINTLLEQQHYLAQITLESGSFKHTRENLNYSADGLARTWPSRYAVDPKASVKVPNSLAMKLNRNPQAIANNVYANRLGNGDEASGDGWNFRGVGLIQLTGKDNIKNYSHDTYGDERAVDNPEMLNSAKDAVFTSAWFWKTHGCNGPASRDDIKGVTKIVNGGYNGLEERAAWLKRAKETIKTL